MKYPGIPCGLALLGLCSCGHIHTKSHSYRGTSSATINGAKVTSAVKPMGGKSGFALSAMVYMAGSATLDGPFIWRIEAEGQQGIHRKMVVHRVKVVTSKTKRSEWYPRRFLGFDTLFKPYKREPGKVFAVYQIPGKLKVWPRTDGEITILAEVSVTSTTRSERRLVRFTLKPGTTSKTEFVNVPAEIVKSRHRDPREWKW